MNLLKKIPFYRRYSTKQNAKYWANRSYGWEEYFKTLNHPHRDFITEVLKKFNWISLFEIGCGSGPNLANIARNIGGRQLGGVDINKEAIEICKRNFVGGQFRVGSGDNIMMSDQSTDVVLTDMFLIYVDPTKIDTYLKEIRRITRKIVVLCEYHHTSWWKRQKLRVFSGRHSYNYKKKLEKLGFYDISVIKMPIFEDDNEQSYRHCVVARCP